MNTTSKVLSIPEGFSALKEFGHITQQMIMPVISIKGDKITPLGTGFVIAEGIIVTAKHVIDEFLTINGLKNTVKDIADASLNVLYISDKTHGDHGQFYLGGMIPITRVWYLDDIDIAFCWINKPINTTDNTPLYTPHVKLSPSIPKVGEKILGFGYYKSQIESTSKIRDGKKVVDYSHETAFTTGVVEEVFPVRRDSGMLSFPCFRVSARFEAGMSGGPIFNEKGAVCGVICSSLKEAMVGGYISYCSLVWASLATPVEICLKQGDKLGEYSIYDLIRKDIILSDESIDQIFVKHENDGKRTVSIKVKKDII